MKRLGILLGLAMTIMGTAAAQPDAAAIAQATQGNYRGGFTEGPWSEYALTVHLIAQNNREHLANIYFGPHAPGTPMFSITGKTDEGVTRFKGEVSIPDAPWFGKQSFEGEIVTAGDPPVAGKFTGVVSGPGGKKPFELERVELGSPTLGLAPPSGAVVLFDGASLEDWERYPLTYSITGEGFKVSDSDMITKAEWGSHRLHLEFRTPFMPSARGQQRGNSGVYVQGRYEVQVLDTFGLEPADNFCGGIYQQAVPVANACLPPMEWQTYDIEFHAPKFDASGAKTANATITVEHNGIPIHDITLTDRTPGGMGGGEAPTGNLLLQNHGDGVEYRNVWIVPLDE